jgi:WD40 repeat protein
MVEQTFPAGARVSAGALSRDGRRVIVAVNGPKERAARVFDVETGQLVSEYTGFENDLRCVAISDDGKLAYFASPDRHGVWDTATGKPVTEAGENGVQCAAFVARMAKVVFAYRNGGIGSIDFRVSVRFGDFEDRHRDSIAFLAMQSSGNLMVSAGADRTLRGWEPRIGHQTWELLDLAEPVKAVAFTPDGRRMVTASARGWTVWELRE